MTALNTHTSYDEIPYESNPFPQTHPDRLSMLGRLFGIATPDVTSARVLELGCAAGGNIIPIAARFPNAKIVGVDFSQRQIDDGKSVIQKLGLTNIELIQADISKLDSSIGMFDYIICHGVYSWVPQHVQDRILEICRDNLTPNGVAYISYNVYPGWHMSGMIRDMMVYHAARFKTPQEKAGQSRALIDFLSQHAPARNSTYGTMLKESLEALKKQPDAYLIHEYLEEFNQPLYFYQFNDRATKAGLQYLGESDVAEMLDSRFPADVQKTLRNISPDIIHMEQYLDFLGRRTFRQTLLVHASVKVNRSIKPQAINDMFIMGVAKPESPAPDYTTSKPEVFKSPRSNITVTDPIVKSALLILMESNPNPVSFLDLFNRAVERARVNVPDATVRAQLMQNFGVGMLQCFTFSQVNFHTTLAHLTTKISEKPVAYPIARQLAEKSLRVTNVFHESIMLTDLDRQTLRLLDGTNDHAAIVERQVDLAKKNVLVVKEKDVVITDDNVLRRVFSEQVKPSIERIGRAALLVG